MATVDGTEFTLAELVDLALCSPEIGAVNFNILRILLHEVLKKLGILDQKAAVNDLQSNQINNFKNYIQGAGTASPMPGVLRYAPEKQSADPTKTPRTGRQDQPKSGGSSSQSTPSQSVQQQPQTKPTGVAHAYYTRLPSAPQQVAYEELDKESGRSEEPLERKVARLERHLEALYALPTNSRLLGIQSEDETETKNMSVNDMWQIIQLNNRVAAAEAAIQKMASLIEELASQIKLLKRGDKPTIRKEMDKLARTSSDLTTQLEPCCEKVDRTAETVDRLKFDLEKIKQHLLEEIKKLSVAAGLDVTSAPSFMLPRKSLLDDNGQLISGPRGQGSVQADSSTVGGQRDPNQPGVQIPGQADFSKLSTQFSNMPVLPPNIIETHAGSPSFSVKTRGVVGQSLEVDGIQQNELMAVKRQYDDQGRLVRDVEWLDSNGQPVNVDFDENGLPILYGPDGTRILNPADIQYDADGQPLYFGADGQRIFGIQRSFGSDGQVIPSDQNSRSNASDEGGKICAEPPCDDDLSSAHGKHSELEDLTAAHPDTRYQGMSHVPVDIVSGKPKGPLDPFLDFQYPTILEDGTVVPGKMDPRYEEECEDQADLVQKELQEQYVKLVEMQRQMAAEIQDKMEIVYQKLLKEIAAQHATTSPYMAVGLNTEKCFGPGVCSGFGLPAGTAVCQFQQKPDKFDVCTKDGAVCPGKDVCPGKEVCPVCKDDILHHLRAPEDRSAATSDEYPKSGLTSSKENLLRQMTSMTLLPRDLEDLREKLKTCGTIPDVFDEADVLEKLQTVWEALNIIKNNEENMAVRIVQQDAILKQIPEAVLQKLGRMSDTALDNLDSQGRLSRTKELTGEDAQVIFNNLSSLLLENAAMKERLDKINEVLHDFEQTVVTKPMLMNSLGDKADKGQMNTKVSYDEFGAGMDEIQSRVANLMQEMYRKNELWTALTDQIREDLGEKLDKVDIGPLRVYFKNHLGKLEEKVTHLTAIMEEPDPAGTRKKLLKDYNCISCDHHTNISGVTNAPQIPVLGPIPAGHTRASQRAFELYRMRPQTSGYDSEGRNYCQIERQRRCDANNNLGDSMALNQSDVARLVNRYVGGSHTSVSPRERIASLHKRVSMTGKRVVSQAPARPQTAAPTPTVYYEE